MASSQHQRHKYPGMKTPEDDVMRSESVKPVKCCCNSDLEHSFSWCSQRVAHNNISSVGGGGSTLFQFVSVDKIPPEGVID